MREVISLISESSLQSSQLAVISLVYATSTRMPAFRSEKLRVNLRLSINRLKLLEKKKSEVLFIIFCDL